MYSNVLRTWLNETLYNGFADEIKNVMKTQDFLATNTISDKVKCPSLNELGCGDTSAYGSDYGGKHHDIEGTLYPIFGDAQSNPNKLAIMKRYDSAAFTYWTRSRCTNGFSGVWMINTGGNCTVGDIAWSSSIYGCVAIIRFGK